MRTPLIVTHPSTLLHDGLRRLFAKSQFGPVAITPALNEELESQMDLTESCIWLMGVSRFDATTQELLRRVMTAAPGVKPVILSACRAPGDVAAALGAGACGFLGQDISAEQLLKSLELIACGQTVLHRNCRLGQPAPNPVNDAGEEHGGCQTGASPPIASRSRRSRRRRDFPRAKSRTLFPARAADPAHAHRGRVEQGYRAENGDHRVDGEGAHEGHPAQASPAELDEAAMWARNHVDEAVWAGLSTPGPAGSGASRQGRNVARRGLLRPPAPPPHRPHRLRQKR